MGQWPPGSSTGSTPSRSRATRRAHAGVAVRSSVQTMYEVGTSGQNSRGVTSRPRIAGSGRSRRTAPPHDVGPAVVKQEADRDCLVLPERGPGSEQLGLGFQLV